MVSTQLAGQAPQNTILAANTFDDSEVAGDWQIIGNQTNPGRSCFAKRFQ